jgi:hypothetical protein
LKAVYAYPFLPNWGHLVNPKPAHLSTKTASPYHTWTPCLLEDAPINALQKHRKLRTAQADLALLGRRPDKLTPLKPLGEQARSLAIPPDHLDLIATTAPE